MNEERGFFRGAGTTSPLRAKTRASVARDGGSSPRRSMAAPTLRGPWSSPRAASSRRISTASSATSAGIRDGLVRGRLDPTSSAAQLPSARALALTL